MGEAETEAERGGDGGERGCLEESAMVRQHGMAWHGGMCTRRLFLVVVE